MRGRRLPRSYVSAILICACLGPVAAAVDYDDFPPQLQQILDERIAELDANGGICVAGRVTFDDGRPITGGEDVQVNMHDRFDEPHQMFEGGWFIMKRTHSSIHAGEGRRFVVRAFGYDPIDADRTILDGQMTYLDFVMFPTPVELLASAEGIVTDEDSQPFLGARVNIKFPYANFGSNSSGSSHPQMNVTTTASGEFSFSGLSSCEYSLVASAAGYAFHAERFTPPPGEIAVQDRRLYPNRQISIEYVLQTDGSRSFAGGALQSGIINWLHATGGVDFSEDVVEGYDSGDLRDLELWQYQDVLAFDIFYGNGRNGFYDAGAVDFASLLEANESGYSAIERPCLVGHVYVVRTYEEDQYVKFLVRSDESSFRTVVQGDPDPIEFAGYGLTIDFTFSSGYSKVYVEKHFGLPPVISDDALPYYLDLSGMDGTTFAADMVFTYDEADVIDHQFREMQLTLMQSLDGGFTWYELDAVRNIQTNTLTVEGLTELGWFAIANLGAPRPARAQRLW